VTACAHRFLRHHASRPPLAKIRPGRPAPKTGPGTPTDVTVIGGFVQLGSNTNYGPVTLIEYGVPDTDGIVKVAVSPGVGIKFDLRSAADNTCPACKNGTGDRNRIGVSNGSETEES
jgi:hypothetical protein